MGKIKKSHIELLREKVILKIPHTEYRIWRSNFAFFQRKIIRYEVKLKIFRLRRAVVQTNKQKPCCVILVVEKTPPEGRRKFLGTKNPTLSEKQKKNTDLCLIICKDASDMS